MINYAAFPAIAKQEGDKSTLPIFYVIPSNASIWVHSHHSKI